MNDSKSEEVSKCKQNNKRQNIASIYETLTIRIELVSYQIKLTNILTAKYFY